MLVNTYLQPKRLHLETTQKCNFHCQHCYTSSSSNLAHHDLEQLKNIIYESYKLGAKKVTLTGGEIFTRPDWKEILIFASKYFDNIYILTNGSFLNKRVFQFLASIKVKKILQNLLYFRSPSVTIGLGISLDGFIGHNKNRNRDLDYNTLLKIIERATEYGLYITINTTVTNIETAQELGEMYDIISTLSIDRWQIDLPFLSGRYKNEILINDKRFLNELFYSYKYIVGNYVKDYPKLPLWNLEIVQVFRTSILKTGFKIIDPETDHPCAYNFGSLIVENGNELRFCPSLRNEKIGDFTNGTLPYLTNSEFKSFSEIVANDLKCKGCSFIKIFHGGCRANSLSYFNELLGKDPYCCILSEFVANNIIPLLPKHAEDSFLNNLTNSGSYVSPDFA